MNRDQAKGHVKDMAGKARQKIGAMTGNRKQQAKGVAQRAEGKAQKAVGDARNIARGNTPRWGWGTGRRAMRGFCARSCRARCSGC